MELKPESHDDELLRMEVYVLIRLHFSTHSCKIYDYGKTKKFSFVVMELLGKSLGDLRKLNQNKKMSEGTVLQVAYQLTEAIADLHSAGFIHRDIKLVKVFSFW